VEVGNPTAQHVVRARREVIVSSGPLNSPKLLHLSGVGPAGVLRDLGIDVLHELPGVGENLHDHYGARGVVRIRNSKTANDLSRWPYLGWEILKWLTGRPSIVGLSASIAYVFWKSDEVLDRPDLQFVLTPISFKAGQFGVLDDFPACRWACGRTARRVAGTCARKAPTRSTRPSSSRTISPRPSTSVCWSQG
jgi:choline dehydrogenase